MVDTTVWHGWLGHPQSRILNFLHHNKCISINKKSSILCTSCALNKCCRLPFFPSTSKANVRIAKIHCDLWGPTPVLSNQGFWYYVVC